MVDFVTGLAGVKTAIDGIKGIRSAYDELQTLKVGLDSIDEERLMLHLDKQILELEKALHNLDRENHELKVQLVNKQNYEDMGFDRHIGTKTRKGQDGSLEHFCTSCLARDGILVQMSLGNFANGPGCRCPTCDKFYG